MVIVTEMNFCCNSIKCYFQQSESYNLVAMKFWTEHKNYLNVFTSAYIDCQPQVSKATCSYNGISINY